MTECQNDTTNKNNNLHTIVSLGGGIVSSGTLSPSDMAALDALARTYAAKGKRLAWHAYTGHAIKHAWGDTPRWVIGRHVFTARWREYRAAYLASQQVAA